MLLCAQRVSTRNTDALEGNSLGLGTYTPAAPPPPAPSNPIKSHDSGERQMTMPTRALGLLLATISTLQGRKGVHWCRAWERWFPPALVIVVVVEGGLRLETAAVCGSTGREKELLKQLGRHVDGLGAAEGLHRGLVGVGQWWLCLWADGGVEGVFFAKGHRHGGVVVVAQLGC